MLSCWKAPQRFSRLLLFLDHSSTESKMMTKQFELHFRQKDKVTVRLIWQVERVVWLKKTVLPFQGVTSERASWYLGLPGIPGSVTQNNDSFPQREGGCKQPSDHSFQDIIFNIFL